MKKELIQQILVQVIDDLNWKYGVKLEDPQYIEDNGYDKLPEAEKQANCFNDARQDLMSCLQDDSIYRDCETQRSSFNNNYYAAYHELGGAAACRKAVKLTEEMNFNS